MAGTSDRDGHILVAFDFGLRRIGIATANRATRTASPLTTLRTQHEPLWQDLDRIIDDWRPAQLVVGVPEGAGVEAAAREARYAALESLRSARGLSGIATAHTANDQAETLLMRLARGASLAGAAGIHEATAGNRTAGNHQQVEDKLAQCRYPGSPSRRREARCPSYLVLNPREFSRTDDSVMLESWPRVVPGIQDGMG